MGLNKAGECDGDGTLMKPENKFRTWFIERAHAYLSEHYHGLRVRFQKHADMVTSGVPDMDISIEGLTLWFEFKNFPALKNKRRLDVTPIQQAYLRELTEVCVPSGVLAGLTLGPRKGYDVALYHASIPSHAQRNDFRPWTLAVEQMLTMAKDAARDANHTLSQIGPYRGGLVGHLPLLLPRSHMEVGIDDAHEDGG